MTDHYCGYKGTLRRRKKKHFDGLSPQGGGGGRGLWAKSTFHVFFICNIKHGV